MLLSIWLGQTLKAFTYANVSQIFRKKLAGIVIHLKYIQTNILTDYTVLTISQILNSCDALFILWLLPRFDCGAGRLNKSNYRRECQQWIGLLIAQQTFTIVACLNLPKIRMAGEGRLGGEISVWQKDTKKPNGQTPHKLPWSAKVKAH